MKFTREQPEGIYTIHAVERDRIGINSPLASDMRDEDGLLWLGSSFIISPRCLHRGWGPARLDQLGTEELAPLAELAPEIVLIGTGTHMALPGAAQLAALVGLGIGYELMDSAAACRTYNVLASEGRRVAAAILIE